MKAVGLVMGGMILMVLMLVIYWVVKMMAILLWFWGDDTCKVRLRKWTLESDKSVFLSCLYPFRDSRNPSVSQFPHL